jgi:hypothetical protein
MDFYSDTSKSTFHLVKQATAAVDLEKVASVVEGSTEGLPVDSFGDPKARMYPVHTPEDAILSAAYAAFDKNAAALKNIFSAGKIWGNEDSLRKVAKEVQGHEVAVKFAMDLSIGGKHYELFPYTGGQDIKQAAESFYENRHKLPWAAREKTASVLFTDILGYGGNDEAKVTREAFEYITKAAGFGLPDLEAADSTLCSRWYKDEKNPAYAKVAKILREIKDDPAWDKIAMEAFDALDEETGAKAKYGKSLRLPEEDLYVNSVLTMKTAAEAGIVKLMNGKAIMLSDVDWSKVAHVDPVLYKEAAGGEKAAEVLPTWPRCDADTLVEMLGIPLIAV